MQTAIDLTQKIEVRLPEASRWTKHVEDVAARAKTGHEWIGEWLHGGAMVDLLPGTIIASCKEVGSRKHAQDQVTVSMLMPDGIWSRVGQATGKEWAIELREDTRAMLAMEPAARLERQIRNKIESNTAILAGRTERLTRTDQIIANLETLIDTCGRYLKMPQSESSFELDVQISGETREERLASATRSAQVRRENIADALQKTQETLARQQGLLAALTTSPSEPAPAAEPNPLAEYTIEQLQAEIARRQK